MLVNMQWQQDRWALCERYARYGRASGVNPALMWPTREELAETDEEERALEPQLRETMSTARDAGQTRREEKAARYV